MGIEYGTRRGSLLAAGALALSALTATDGNAAILYGDFNGTNVSYLNVQEDNTGYFGTPTLAGDSLVFNPTSFEAQASGGAIDLVDGTLSFILDASSDTTLNDLTINEAGFYSLIGVGTTATRVIAALAITVQILEVNNVAVVGPVPQTNTSYQFLNANLVADGPAILASWSGAANFDLEAAAIQLGLDGNVTKAAVTINNQLIAISEAGSVAFVDKKGFSAFTVTIPEPGTISLLLAGGTLMMLRRRNAA